MPAAPAIARQSPAEIRRVAWSLLMSQLREIEDGAPMEGAGEILASQVESVLDLSELAVQLLGLATTLWLGQFTTVAEAREYAQALALDMATR